MEWPARPPLEGGGGVSKTTFIDVYHWVPQVPAFIGI